MPGERHSLLKPPVPLERLDEISRKTRGLERAGRPRQVRHVYEEVEIVKVRPALIPDSPEPGGQQGQLLPIMVD